MMTNVEIIYRQFLYALAFLALSSFGCTSNQTQTLEDVQGEPSDLALSVEDIKELKDIAKIHEEAALAGDWEKWLSTCTDDIVLMPPNDMVYVGKENAMTYLKAYPDIIEFSIIVEDLDGTISKAYSWGTCNLTVNISGNSSTREMKYLAVFEKQTDGSWKLSRDMWNTIPPKVK